jgi:cysteine desulfurase
MKNNIKPRNSEKFSPAHKIYGPKGVGALFIRKGIEVEPLLHGGGQERGYRSTTENIPSITGFAKAAELCFRNQAKEFIRIRDLRERLVRNLEEAFENIYFNAAEYTVPGIINFSFGGQEGESIRLLLLLDEAGIAVSTGSACSSNHSDNSGSHVLRAIGRNPVEARGGIRVSIGRYNTAEDIDTFCDLLREANHQLKSIYSY